MINVVDMTFSYGDLDNGVLTINSDNIVASSLLVSNPTVIPKMVGYLKDISANAGTGCYDGIYFTTPFDGEISIRYSSYHTGRSDVSKSNLELPQEDVSYASIINKTTVVPDTERTEIDFSRVSDVDPLLARYILLQQFAGKRLTSLYSISRAMDDYFDNHWSNISVNLAGGYYDPEVPWLRMGVSTGNRLYIDNGKLVSVMSGITSYLHPSDDDLNSEYASVIEQCNRLVRNDDIRRVATKIISDYVPREYNTNITKGGSFSITENGIQLSIGSHVSDINWGHSIRELHKAHQSCVANARDAIALYGDNWAYSEIGELLDSTISNIGITNKFTLNSSNGGYLKIGEHEFNFVGVDDVERVERCLLSAPLYAIPQEFSDTIRKARKIIEVSNGLDVSNLRNEVANSIEDMLNYLS